MGQSDLETDAALAQLNYEELSKTPGGEFVEIIGDLLAFIGTGGLWAVTGGASNLLLKIRKLAGASYAGNLIFAVTAVRNDLAYLYQRHEELRGRIDSLRNDPKFAEAISALALRAMHTSVKDRLARLARIVVNGVKEDDLEPENLDDMMRAAVELKESDIVFLGLIYDSQVEEMVHQSRGRAPSFWKLNFDSVWKAFVEGGKLDSRLHLQYRSSLCRMEAAGLLMRVELSVSYGFGLEPHALLPEGAKFYERLQEIGATK